MFVQQAPVGLLTHYENGTPTFRFKHPWELAYRLNKVSRFLSQRVNDTNIQKKLRTFTFRAKNTAQQSLTGIKVRLLA